MKQRLSRRQFIKQGKATFMGLSAVSLCGVVSHHGMSSESNTDIRIEKPLTLEKQIPQLMRKAMIPGASIAIIKDGEISWSQGFGLKNSQSREPVSTDTVFAAASLSKPVFAYAVLKMCERGELDLDIPLTEYTAKRLISDPRLKLITARMVLSHTSGLPKFIGEDPITISFTPGTKFSYSSEGYYYLQSIIEQMTGQTLNNYMTRHVFMPLGMKNSSYVWQKEYEESAANGHDRQGRPQPMSRPSRASAAGSLRTTATDYAKFLMAMLKPIANDDFQLCEQSLAQMLHPQIKLSPSLTWGLGWALEQTSQGDYFWHWGDIEIFKCFTLASRNLQNGIVILTNSENGLKICQAITHNSIGGQHPAFSFYMIDY